MICKKEHLSCNIHLNDLPNSQKDIHGERHKCAGCAFVAGVKDALNGGGKRNQLDDSIPESQAGAIRHKDAWQAYNRGYAHGLELDS